jgi:hypothetical protein
VASYRSPLDATQPGLVRMHRAAARQCGERIAQASWAIHYWIPVSVIVNTGAGTFIVKTKTGWRFWPQAGVRITATEGLQPNK